MAARPPATADDDNGRLLDQSIHRLLGEINQRREQAARFAQLVEQSIYHTPSARRTQDARRWSAPASDDGFAFAGSVIDSAADERPQSASPPASFLEGFTQHFVDTYRAPSDATADVLGEPYWRRALRDYSDESAISNADLQLPMSAASSPWQPEPVPESPWQPEPVPESPWQPEPVPESPQPLAPAVEHPAQTEYRGVAVIDRAARARLWQRVDSSAPPGDAEDRDETRIQAIVQLAERIAALQTQAAPASPAAMDVAAAAPGAQRGSSDAADLPPCWVPGEWEQWARHAREQPAGPGRLNSGRMAQRLEWVHTHQPWRHGFSDGLVGGGKLNSGRMAQRLEWVHTHQPWRHGFSDGLVGGGKLRRTYRDLPLDLQAYPDGNVKRTAAAARHPVSGARCRATTIYFANGDWSCTLAEPGGDESAYYYYSEEAVWHEQHGAATLHRFADGREERTDARGARTVRYPSGDVRVSLPR